MMKLIFSQLKWLVSLIILVVATLLIGGCPPSNQSPIIPSLDNLFLGGHPPSNQSPIISSLTANNEEEINPADSCQIECTASDPDGDELTYTWSADGGDIIGTGSTVTWTAPDAPGNYTITVEVNDSKDGIATEQLTISVLAPNHPPVIESLVTDCPRVRPAKTAIIECAASDPDGDELSYTWSADRGNITEEDDTVPWEGDTVTWVAPDATGDYTITVTVTDGRGGEASKSIGITVCTCGSACG